MMEAVHRYEGTVNQVMGDGIMALFGAPLAHEDHAVRACYATLRMQETVRRYSDELRHAQTDLIVEPLKVTTVYTGAPALSRFALDDLVLQGGNVTIRGDFGQLPNPFPKRWAERATPEREGHSRHLIYWRR
jgi:hypothetical protein